MRRLLGLFALMAIASNVRPENETRSLPHMKSKKAEVDDLIAKREEAKRYGLKEWNIGGRIVFAATKKAAQKKADKRDAVEQGFGVVRKAA
jgi:hypothetical protein